MCWSGGEPTLALCVPEVELTLGRVEVHGELGVEIVDLVSKLEDLVADPSLVLTDVFIELHLGERLAASRTWKVRGLGERREHCFLPPKRFLPGD